MHIATTNAITTKATTKHEPQQSEPTPHTAGYAAKDPAPTTPGKLTTSTQAMQTLPWHLRIGPATFVAGS